MKDRIVFRTSKKAYTKQEMAAAYESALLLTAEAVPALPVDVQPSESFCRSVGHMSRQYMRTQCLIAASRAAVAVLIVGLLFFGATLSVNAQVRQVVVNWWKEVWENRIVYLWTGEDTAGPKSVRYELGYVPEGYELVESDQEDGFGYSIYESETGSFVFEYEVATNFNALEYVPLGDYTHWQRSVNGMQADVYADMYDADTYTLVLVDELQGYVLYLDAQIDLQIFNAIADGIVVKE